MPNHIHGIFVVGAPLADTQIPTNTTRATARVAPTVGDIVGAYKSLCVHRDYLVSAPVRLFIFDNRIEIISPGHLPNNLTVEKIRTGNSNIRKLPYSSTFYQTFSNPITSPPRSAPDRNSGWPPDREN